jgi:hypothetical protein
MGLCMKFVLRKRGTDASDDEIAGIGADSTVRILDQSTKMVLVDADRDTVDNIIKKLGAEWFATPLDTRFRPAD